MIITYVRDHCLFSATSRENVTTASFLSPYLNPLTLSHPQALALTAITRAFQIPTPERNKGKPCPYAKKGKRGARDEVHLLKNLVLSVLLVTSWVRALLDVKVVSTPNLLYCARRERQMNNDNFDALTKVLFASTSRRQTLKLMGTTLVGSLLSVSCGQGASTSAARTCTSVAGTITEFSTGLTAGGGLVGITAGPDGNLWFTEESGNKIGRISVGCVA